MSFEEEPDFTHLTNSLQALNENLLDRGFDGTQAFQLVKLYFGLTLEAHLSSPGFLSELEGEQPFNNEEVDEDDDSTYPPFKFFDGDDDE